MNKIQTPTMLWQGFDATLLPLDIFEVSTTTTNGIVTKQFYFTGRQFPSGVKTRVYGVVCYKNSNSQKPAVLYIGKPDKPVDMSELLYWANNGFVAMSIDLKGKSSGCGFYTVYPLEADYANYDQKNEFKIFDTAEQTMWYEYTANCMRAVTYLKQLGFVKSISVLTLGKGSYVGLAVMAIDKRVNNGTVVFGNLHTNVDGYVEIMEGDKSKISQALAQNELLDIWTMGIAPQSYLPLIECPVYFILGGNSRHAQILLQSETYSRSNDDSRLLILPDAYNYIPNDITSGIVKWFKEPTVDDDLKLRVLDDQKVLTIELVANADPKDLELWYCRDNTLVCKNWVSATLKNVGENVYTAELDMYEHNANVSVVAVKYGTISISTPMLNFVTKQQYQLKQPTSLVYSGENKCFVPLTKQGKWHGAELSADIVKGYLNIKGTKGTNLCTFALADKSNLFKDSDTISFDICCDTKQVLTVKYIANFGDSAEYYVATAQLFGDGKWQRITLSNSDFKRDTDGHSLLKTASIDALIFDAEEKFIVNNIYAV